jgi:hypothetical protein
MQNRKNVKLNLSLASRPDKIILTSAKGDESFLETSPFVGFIWTRWK